MNVDIVLKTWFQTVILGSLILVFAIALYIEINISFESFSDLEVLKSGVIALMGFALFLGIITAVFSIPALTILCLLAEKVEEKSNAFKLYTKYYFLISLITFTLICIPFYETLLVMIGLGFYYTLFGYFATSYNARSIGSGNK